MKISKNTYNLIVRFIAGVAASLILVGGAGIISNKMPERSAPVSELPLSASLFETASGIGHDDILMTVNGEEITSTEYFFWVSYIANDLNNYYGINDFSQLISDTMTVADYVHSMAMNYVTNYSVVRQWAAEQGFTLSEDDLADMEQERLAAIANYSSEEEYQQQLEMLGYNEEFLRERILPYRYLYMQIADSYTDTDGVLHPSENDLKSFAAAQHMISGKYLIFCPEDLPEGTNAEELANETRERLTTADNFSSEWAAVASELGQEDIAVIFDASSETTIAQAVSELNEGEISDVVTYDGDLFIILRTAQDYSKIAEYKFSYDFEMLAASADIVYTDLFNNLDLADYYANLQAAQAALVPAGN